MRLSGTERDVSGSVRTPQVRRQYARDDGVDPTLVEEIVLDHDVGPTVPWLGTGGLIEIYAEDIPLTDGRFHVTRRPRTGADGAALPQAVILPPARQASRKPRSSFPAGRGFVACA